MDFRRIAAALSTILALSPAAWGQQSSSPFEPALPGYVFEFPRDHGAHATYGTEWWYYTGHLETESGRQIGFELTFFRVGVVPPSAPVSTAWDLREVALAHFAITDVQSGAFRYYEKLSRSTEYTAQAKAGTLDVFNEGWSAASVEGGKIHLVARQGDDAIDLMLASAKPPAVHGENGVSVKAQGVGYASHYYSLTRLEGSGSATVGGKKLVCSALVWMDHEFGSSGLKEGQQGWDWFSVQLDNETELMLYQIRRADGKPDVTSSGSFILPNGDVIHLRREQFRITPLRKWHSAKSGATYPMGWRIEVLPLKLSIEVREQVLDQELITNASTRVTYWEGAVTAAGSFGGTPVRGKGYVELTGYAR